MTMSFIGKNKVLLFSIKIKGIKACTFFHKRIMVNLLFAQFIFARDDWFMLVGLR